MGRSMKVSELIEALQALPGYSEVLLADSTSKRVQNVRGLYEMVDYDNTNEEGEPTDIVAVLMGGVSDNSTSISQLASAFGLEYTTDIPYSEDKLCWTCQFPRASRDHFYECVEDSWDQKRGVYDPFENNSINYGI